MVAKSATRSDRGPSWEQCWIWFCAALVMLLWIDLATTVAAANLYGLEAEANPLMRSLLASGISITVAIHVILFGLAIAGFAVVVAIGRKVETNRRSWYRRFCFCWIMLLLLIGVLVVANNMALVLIALIG